VKFKDYYEVMGLGRDASAEDVKRAYRRLARKYHPDVSKELDAEERFKELGEAYEVLRDPEKRAAYDRLGSEWRPGQDFEPPPDWSFEFEGEPPRAGSHSDFFENLFGFAGGRGGFRARGLDTAAEVTLSLEEAFRGTERSLSLRQLERGADGRPQQRVREIKVKVPPGVVDGQQLRVPAQGGPGVGGDAAGDLFLRLRLAPHRFFRTEGRHVWLDLPVTPWEAALGETVRVPTLGGRVDLRLPKGSQTDRQLRLKGRGLPGNPPGDQFVVLKVVVPPADTGEREELYRRMAAEMPLDPRRTLED
jgi:curved DNA-binding protein